MDELIVWMGLFAGVVLGGIALSLLLRLAGYLDERQRMRRRLRDWCGREADAADLTPPRWTGRWE